MLLQKLCTFKDLQAYKAVFFRLGHDIIQRKNNLWTEWVQASHTRRWGFWYVPKSNKDSWVWSNLLKLRGTMSSLMEDNSQDGEIAFTKPNGSLDTRGLYKSIRKRNPKVPWCDVVWNEVRARKWSFRLWLAIRGRLTTRERMHKWGLVESDRCPFCGVDVETMAHLWWSCTFTSQVMDRVWSWVGVHTRKANLVEWMDWFVECNDRKRTIFKVKLLALHGIVYFVWKYRNDVVFKGIRPDVAECTNTIMYECKMRMLATYQFEGRSGALLRRQLGV